MARSPSSRNKVRNPVESRRAITVAAIKIFSQGGFAQASFQAIANEAGLSQAAVFYHFPNREALVNASLAYVVERNHSTVSGLFKPEDNAEERLLKHGAANVKWGLENRDEAQVLLLVYYLACCNSDFSKIYVGMLAAARKRIEELLLAGIREQTLRLRPEEAAKIAECLHDALLGSFIGIMTTGPRGTRAKQKVLTDFTAHWRNVVTRWVGLVTDGA